MTSVSLVVGRSSPVVCCYRQKRVAKLDVEKDNNFGMAGKRNVRREKLGEDHG
jgi:hypothetical protein